MSFADEVNAAGETGELLAHIEQLRKENKALQRKYDKARIKTKDMVAAIYAAAKESIESAGPLVPISPSAAGTKKQEMALLHLTDWQYGKVTPSFSMKICENRIEQAVAKTEELTEIQRADHPVNECHVLLGGDMVEGETVFPGQFWEIEADLLRQVRGAAALIARSVSRLCEVFPRVVVWEESGNHGRLGLKGQFSPDSNADRMTYDLARMMVVSKSLTWNEQTNWYNLCKIGNYTFVLAHGDEIGAFGSIANTAIKWGAKVLEPFEDIYLGHFHTPTTLTLANSHRVFVTGSPESDNEYAAKRLAATNTPTQRLHFVDPRKGRVTSEHTLWLD